MSILPKRKLGRTDMNVTVLGYGAMEIRGPRIWSGREVTDVQAQTILHAVLDAGINFIDTSNDYGRSEEFIGRFIAGRRKEYFLATKCGCKVTRKDDKTDETPHEFTRSNCFRGLEESLARLKTDRVDLVQLHNPPADEAKAQNLVEVLTDMKRQGKTRWIGISTSLPHIATYLEWGVFDTFQIPYSALDRTHEAWIEKSGKAGVGIICRGGVQQGEPGIGRGNKNRWANFEAARLDELREPGESRTNFMLRYTLSHPQIDTIIAGTLSPEHLKENLAVVAKGALKPDVYAEAKKRLDAAGQKPEPA
ncbi:MAG: aldo/keto reductase [Planctomycetes bacterium]|nr:aldo/keto reductase [Planctomycetota bacterium]